jgi:DNA-binding transcriptional regulator PaaX
MEYIETNSLTEHILAFLLSSRSTRLYFEMLREMRIKRYKKQAVTTALSRMKKKGWIEGGNNEWKITKDGIRVIKAKYRFDLLPSPFTKSDQKKTIVAFDIPETHRREREWLRNQLKTYHYVMIQKSLWQGPGPLPEEFTKHTKELQIDTCIKKFTLAEK